VLTRLDVKWVGNTGGSQGNRAGDRGKALRSGIGADVACCAEPLQQKREAEK